MADIQTLREYREKLQDARFSGVRTLRDSNGEEVTYRSQREIELAIAAIDSEINHLQRWRAALIGLHTSKGL